MIYIYIEMFYILWQAFCFLFKQFIKKVKFDQFSGNYDLEFIIEDLVLYIIHSVLEDNLSHDFLYKM